MSDKLPAGAAALPTFSAGEKPTAQKLTSISAQLRRVALQLEKAIGDVHDESWPYMANEQRLSPAWGLERIGLPDAPEPVGDAETRSLDIANLARLIGPSSNLNPRMSGTTSQVVSMSVPSGKHEFALLWPIDDDGLTYPGLGFSGTGSVFTTLVGTIAAMNATGEYYIDLAKHRVYTFDATSGGTMTYTTSPWLYGGGLNPQSATFNVLPDPNQITAGGDGCAVTGPVSGVYTVTLPTITHQQSNYLGLTDVLAAADPNFAVQLTLPHVLTTVLAASEAIPAGFLYLKNFTTNEVYTDASYTYNNETSIKVSGVDLSEAISNADSFILVTVGTDITSSIDDLRTKSFHSHDRRFGEPPVHIDDIAGILEDEPDSGPYFPSAIPGNFAPQYLHRDGFQDAGNENAMRGSLVMGPAEEGSVSLEFRSDLDDASWSIRETVTEDLEVTRAGAENRNLILSPTGTGRVRATKPVSANAGIAFETAQTPIKIYHQTASINPNSVGDHTVSLSVTGVALVIGLNVIVKPTSGSASYYAPGINEGTYPFSARYVIADNDVVITFEDVDQIDVDETGGTSLVSPFTGSPDQWNGASTATAQITLIYQE